MEADDRKSKRDTLLDGPRETGKQYSVWLLDGDLEILRWVMNYLGTENRSEVMRTSLRAFATHLKALDTDLRGRKFDK